jgi:hypothetical protein
MTNGSMRSIISVSRVKTPNQIASSCATWVPEMKAKSKSSNESDDE